MLFKIGREYSRKRDIHDRYKGSRQGGISPSTKVPAVFLFTGRSGEQFGYDDQWIDDAFHFTGEGQAGDMQFTHGNKAVRDHVADRRELHLFRSLGRGKPCRYEGQFICTSWRYDSGPDRDGNERKTIVFHLEPFENVGTPHPVVDDEEAGEAETVSIDELRRRAHEASNEAPEGNASQGGRTVYRRSKDVSRYVLARANGRCEFCGKDAPFRRRNGILYLEPHHIKRLSDGGPDHPRWVAGLCPDCHREVHFGENGPEIDKRLEQMIAQIESVPL